MTLHRRSFVLGLFGLAAAAPTLAQMAPSPPLVAPSPPSAPPPAATAPTPRPAPPVAEPRPARAAENRPVRRSPRRRVVRRRGVMESVQTGMERTLGPPTRFVGRAGRGPARAVGRGIRNVATGR